MSDKPEGTRKLTLQEKIDENIWDHVKDFAEVYRLMKGGKWHWFNNNSCKYVNLRVDMRDGGCLIMDRNGNRIDPEQLKFQASKEKPE